MYVLSLCLLVICGFLVSIFLFKREQNKNDCSMLCKKKRRDDFSKKVMIQIFPLHYYRQHCAGEAIAYFVQ